MAYELEMQSTVLMKIAKIGSMVLSIILCSLGFIRILMPQLSVEKFSTFCGIVLIVFGCVRILGFYSKDLFRLAFQYDFEFGIIIILLGILTVIRPLNFGSSLCVLWGILVVADALFKIRISFDAKQFGIEQWWLLLLFAIAGAVQGGIQAFYLGEKMDIVLGTTLIVEGVLSLSTVTTLVKIIQHQVKV